MKKPTPRDTRTHALVAIAIAAMCLPAGAALAGDVGTVRQVVNSAVGAAPSASPETLYKNDAIVADEAVQTFSASSLNIRFVDGTELVVGADSNVKIDRFAYDPQAGTGAAALSFTKGAFRWATGDMPKDGIAIDTPNATIGVRGTRFTMRIQPDGSLGLWCQEGQVEIKSKTGGGSASVGAGQSATVSATGAVGEGKGNGQGTGDDSVDGRGLNGGRGGGGDQNHDMSHEQT